MATNATIADFSVLIMTAAAAAAREPRIVLAAPIEPVVLLRDGAIAACRLKNTRAQMRSTRPLR